jgi:phosphate transport system permease protein
MPENQTQEVQHTVPPPLKPDFASTEIPARFLPPRSTLLIDHFMTQFIKVGGLLIIAAVFGIFVFILSQVLPLFKGARIHELRSVQLPKKDYVVLGDDEWTEFPVLLTTDGTAYFVDLTGPRGIQVGDPRFADKKQISAFHYDQQHQQIVFGTEDGYFSVASLNYSTNYIAGKRVVVQDLQASPFYEIGQRGFPIRTLDYADSGTGTVIIAIQEVNGKKEVHAAKLDQQSSLLGTGEIQIGNSVNLTPHIPGEPQTAAVSSDGSDIVVSTMNGDVLYFVMGDEVTRRQVFRPFGDLKNPSISSMNFLFGGQSLVFTGAHGENRIFSLYEKSGENFRSFGQTKQFEPLPGPADFYASSVRNKAFLTGSGSLASLRYATTANIRWQENLPFQISKAIISGKYNRILFLDRNSVLHLFELQDLHPESGFKALFGKIWYEGAPRPDYTWQSTGGTDDFEPKLSLMPLIVGTLKGTFYAMLFALPIALLAAVYTSQFLHPDFRIYVKPTMEIMASLPSVVLGFLAALWLAPILENRVPSILVMILFLPAIALLCGWLWSLLPIHIRILVRPGYEWIFFLPVLFATGYFAWLIGPWIERLFFAVKDPSTGASVADFRLWWPHVTHLPYEQRNSLVVGFMMGFAVIPIIFTIAEDALSNVPQALRSGSLALGASRWQTALWIVIPTASAGIFSAIMIGLGRAVGETMIVVMATGNTPIMDFNIFSGMRTLSANIAVELPEAPANGTLFRTLFLGGLVLFIMTFAVNTLAEILRQHLREKYKTV